MYIQQLMKKRSSEIKTLLTDYLHTDSSSDDASIPEERISTPDREYNYPRDHLCNSRDKGKNATQRDNSERRLNNLAERRPQNLPPPVNQFNDFYFHTHDAIGRTIQLYLSYVIIGY